MKTASTYRPEIDGLRAVAVLAVILFHADVPGFGGGYVGVDVFFVISGYLITSLIVAERDAGTFSLLRFYERRARRILPALLVVLCVVVVGTWVMLLPIETVNVYPSVVAALAMASNILFWKESGYFDTAADLKPLLHTWSLAVEEQFYLLYPLVVLGLLRMGRRWFASALGVVAVASLAAAQWVAGTDPEAAFFLLPMRAWELLAGCLLAWFLPNHRREWQAAAWHRKCRQIGSLMGLAFVAVPIVMYIQNMQAAAYLTAPVLGAALVIAFATPETIVGKLLSSRPAVGVGLISYSAYLIHQPLFVATRMMHTTAPALTTMLAASCAAVVLAWALQRFVEQPFRRSDFMRRRTFVLAAVTCTVTVGGVGVVGNVTSGFESLNFAMMPEKKVQVYRNTFETRVRPGQSECRIAMPQMTTDEIKQFDACAAKYGRALLVIGDSHGRDLYDGLVQSSEYPFIVFAPIRECNSPPPKCVYGSYSELIQGRKSVLAHVVFFGAGYPNFLAPTGWRDSVRSSLQQREPPKLDVNVTRVDAWIERIDRTIEVMDRGKVVFLGPYIDPQLPVAMQFRYAIDCRPGRIVVHRNIVEAYKKLDEFIFRRTAHRAGMQYVSSLALLAPDVETYLYDCDAAYWRDGDHLTPAGQRRLALRLLAAHPELVGEVVDSR